MNVTFLGTGAAINNGRLLNSILVDAEILLDPSPTSVWAMQALGLSFKRLRAILVTHVHADHTFGFPQLLVELKVRARRKIPILAPPAFEKWLRRLLSLGYPGSRFDLRVIEMKPGATHRLAPWTFRAIAMRHTVPAQGYLLTKRGQTLGYSGDSALGPGVRRLLAQSDAAILEMTSSEHQLEGHLTCRDIERLAPTIPVIVTHLSELRPRVPTGIRIARDLESICLP